MGDASPDYDGPIESLLPKGADIYVISTQVHTKERGKKKKNERKRKRKTSPSYHRKGGKRKNEKKNEAASERTSKKRQRNSIFSFVPSFDFLFSGSRLCS